MTTEELLHQYRSIYYNFPQSLKTFLGSLYGTIPLSVRFGKGYDIHTHIIQKFENSNEQYKLDFMYNKTLETLLFAEENITYYKNLFNEYGVSSQSFKSLDDIKLFPILTKNDIKRNIDNLYTQSIEKAVPYYSGGSLSTPSKYFLPVSSRAKEKAYNNYIFAKIGYEYRDQTLLLKGREVSIPEKNIFWEYEPVDNYFLLSNNYMNSDKFPLMYEKAKEFKPSFLFGYPSAVLSFIKQSKLHSLPRLEIRGVMLASETVYPDELKIIEEYFGVDVLSHYGHTERNAIGYRVNEEKYNFMNSYGLVREENSELVTTTFDNFVMPFINYKSGDSVAGNINYYDGTDVVKDVDNIEGRTQDFLVTKDERLVSITTMCGGQHLPLETMDAIQYIQNENGCVTVLVEGNNIDTKKVREGMCKLVREGIEFDVKTVNKIEKTHREKRVICKQSLDIEKIRKK
jgi:phenylacetate-CoA ligase